MSSSASVSSSRWRCFSVLYEFSSAELTMQSANASGLKIECPNSSTADASQPAVAERTLMRRFSDHVGPTQSVS